ncbi:hypothetical protein JXM67_13840 [candidate division WOR-3 bacterium]|nr:hypothetical protein [candidate division WOR-3 bacterium]
MIFSRVLVVAVTLSAIAVRSGTAEIYRPVSVTFTYPLSTNGIQAGEVVSNFPVNIIGGYLGSVEELGLGFCYNIETYHMYGLQISGVVNVVGQDIRGVQLSGTINYALQVAGAQIGVVNVAGHVRGLQLGIVNVAGNLEGVPIGLVSVVKRGAVQR